MVSHYARVLTIHNHRLCYCWRRMTARLKMTCLTKSDQNDENDVPRRLAAVRNGSEARTTHSSSLTAVYSALTLPYSQYAAALDSDQHRSSASSHTHRSSRLLLWRPAVWWHSDSCPPPPLTDECNLSRLNTAVQSFYATFSDDYGWLYFR